MSNYAQETDSRLLLPLPRELRFPVRILPTNQTTGSILHLHYFAVASNGDLFRKAWNTVLQIGNTDIRSRARAFLQVLQRAVTSLQQAELPVINVPPLYAVVTDDGAVLFEWIFESFRVG